MAGGVLRAGKRFFFPSLVSLAEEKSEFLASYRKNQINFRNKCTSCGATRSKRKFVGLGEGINLLCRKCYNKMRRSPGFPDSKDKSVTDSTAAQTSTEGGKLGLIYNCLRTCFKKFKSASLLCVSE